MSNAAQSVYFLVVRTYEGRDSNGQPIITEKRGEALSKVYANMQAFRRFTEALYFARGKQPPKFLIQSRPLNEVSENEWKRGREIMDGMLAEKKRFATAMRNA